MEFSWSKYIILIFCLIIESSAAINEDKDDKILHKRQASITVENVASCNNTRRYCIESCRGLSSCEKDCPICPETEIFKELRRVVVEGVNDTFVHDTPIHGNNVTTVIKLVNLVNNTNLIDIPTNVNLTNQNHVHVYQNDSSDEGGEFGLGYNRFGSCCIVVEPRTCNPTSRGYSCHHKRHKTCGQQCTSRIIHAERRHSCSGGNCSHRVGYVPQPKRPRCIYTPVWPFVSCGGYHKQSCEGCYEHYGYGANRYYGGRIPTRCTSCYDDAFNMGPLYRRGPFFQPFYYHQPPCYVTRSCHVPFCTGYGCFGHENVDPAWGYWGGGAASMGPMMSPMGSPIPMMSPMGSPIPMMPDYRIASHISRSRSPFPTYPSMTIEDDSPEYVEIHDSLPHVPQDGSDWGVELTKCRVVENNGTVTIKNCSDTEWNRNRYASSPSLYPHLPDGEIYETSGYDSDYTAGYEREIDENRYNPPSSYDGYERTAWDNEISDSNRNLHRRHAKDQRKHRIIYDD